MEKGNRRNFLKNLALAFTILPSAGRVWKVERRAVINPAWVRAEYELAFGYLSFAQIRTIYNYALENFAVTPNTNDNQPTNTPSPNPTQVGPVAGEVPIVYRRDPAGWTKYILPKPPGQDPLMHVL